MSHFLHETVSDIRHGRETWRVFVTLCSAAFVIAVSFVLSRGF
jgi:hypothetical protein